MRDPLVSVIIPAFNAQRFLPRTLDSVLSQTYQNFEILIVDDASTDATRNIAVNYSQRDGRITVLSNETNFGVAQARNRAIERSRGEFIAPLDADDLWYAEKIEAQVRAFQQAKPEVGVVYTWVLKIDESDNVIGAYGGTFEGDVFLESILFRVSGTSSCPLMRRSSLERVGYYDTILRERRAEGYEDWDLDIRMARNFHFACVPRYLLGYRVARGSMSKDSRTMHRSAILVLQKTMDAYTELPRCVQRWQRSAIDFYWAIEETSFMRKLALLVSSLIRDPYRIPWLWSVPSRIIRRLRRLLTSGGTTKGSRDTNQRKQECIRAHQQLLESPERLSRLVQSRIGRLKNDVRATRTITVLVD